MNMYIVLMISIFAVWYISDYGRLKYRIQGIYQKESYNFFLVSSFLFILFLSAFRGKSVGTDTISYIAYYENILYLPWSGLFNGSWDGHWFTTEKGFMILEKLCNELFIPTQLYLAICAAIYLYGIYTFCNKYLQHSKLLGIVTFLALGGYLMSLNAMRQAIGVGICYFAWTKLKNGNQKSFILLVLLACLFHVSCFVFLVALLFEKIPANKKNIFLFLFANLGITTVGIEIVNIVIRFFPVYAFRYGFGRWKISEANGIIGVWIIIGIIIAITIFKSHWNQENHIAFEVLLFSMCYITINIIGLQFDGVQRLSMLFQPFLIILFDNFSRLLNDKVRFIYKCGVVVCMIVLFLFASSTEQYVYIPFWQ